MAAIPAVSEHESGSRLGRSDKRAVRDWLIERIRLVAFAASESAIFSNIRLSLHKDRCHEQPNGIVAEAISRCHDRRNAEDRRFVGPTPVQLGRF